MPFKASRKRIVLDQLSYGRVLRIFAWNHPWCGLPVGIHASSSHFARDAIQGIAQAHRARPAELRARIADFRMDRRREAT
jgi:hypothetical protein